MVVFYKVVVNFISFGLYVSLGFVLVECWMDFEGNVIIEEVFFVNWFCGFFFVIGSLNIIVVL